MLAFCMQYTSGGGLYVGGVANLDGCNVFSNEAFVRPPDAPSLSLLQRPAGTFRVIAFVAVWRWALHWRHIHRHQLHVLLLGGFRRSSDLPDLFRLGTYN